MTNAVACQG